MKNKEAERISKKTTRALPLSSSKRSQITLFVIIAIILVAGISTYFIITKQAGKRVDTDVQGIYDYVQSCVDDALTSGLAMVGLSGGYIIPPAESLFTDYGAISYWYYEENDTFPFLEDIEKQINFNVEISTILCTNFSQFPSFTIEEGNITAKSKIEAEKTSVEVDWPLVIKKGDKTYKIEKPYKSEQPVRLGKLYDFAKGVVYREIIDPDTIDTDYLLSEPYFNVTIIPYEDTLIYSITDLSDKNKLEDLNYVFMFANKFAVNLTEIEG